MIRRARRNLALILAVIATLAVVVVVVLGVRVSGDLKSRLTADELHAATQHANESLARQFDDNLQTGNARIGSCAQSNKANQAIVVGNIRSQIAHDRRFAEAGVFRLPTTEAGRALALLGLVEFAQEQYKAHPPRDCTPHGLDVFLGQCPGTTLAQLHRKPTPTCRHP